MVLGLAACGDPPSGPVLPPPDPGTMRVEITGHVTHDSTWSAFGEFRDVLATDSGDLSLLGGQSLTASRLLTLVFPGRLDKGSFAIGQYIYGTTPDYPAAFVLMDTSFYASIPGGIINIASADYPPRPGLDPGLMTGALVFHAVRLTAGPGGVPIETADTIMFSASFVAHWYHYLRPNVAVTLNGAGPVLGASLASVGQSVDDDHGGRFVWWESDFDGVSAQAFPYEISQEFRLAAPAVGTFTLGQVTPHIYADPLQWPAAFSALYYRDDPRIALSAGGTLSVTEFLAPTDAYYGEIHGTLDAPLALWANDTTVTADTVHVVAHFAVQLWPLGGIPASPPLSPIGWRLGGGGKELRGWNRHLNLVTGHHADRLGALVHSADRVQQKPHLR